jgi:hypothetical protein
MSAAASLPIDPAAATRARALEPAAAPPRNGWIVSRGYDLTFFVGSLAAPLLLWAAFEYGFLTGVAVFAIFQLAFNMPHNFQTWTMSVFDADDRAKNGRRYAVALFVVLGALALPALLSPNGVYPLVRDALVYWGYYHLVRQHFGFQRLYERRMAVAGSPASPRESQLYARFLEVVSYAPLLLRFRDPERMTIHVGERAIWVRHPILPPWLWHAIAAVYAAVIVAAIAHHVIAALRGRKHLAPRALLFAAVTLCFGLAGIVIKDIVVAIAIVTSFHNLQYLGLVWFHNRTRATLADKEGIPRGKNRPIDLIRSGRVPVYILISALYGLVLIVPIALFPGNVLAELPINGMVALHYYVDARVWRFGDYPQLARFLKLKP